MEENEFRRYYRTRVTCYGELCFYLVQKLMKYPFGHW